MDFAAVEPKEMLKRLAVCHSDILIVMCYQGAHYPRGHYIFNL